MPDDKTTKAPETAAPDTGPGKTPEQAPVKEPVKTEPSAPEQKPPEQDADKAAPPKDTRIRRVLVSSDRPAMISIVRG